MSAHAHEEHEHRPTWQYLAIAVMLTFITAFELGPLFDLYRLPAALLLVLSAFKFFTVVAFYMHLWDDAPIFTRLFAAPMIGASLMVFVLMVLNRTLVPSPWHDAAAVEERYGDRWNKECSSWLRSSHSNRWYCASPLIASDRVLRESKVLDGQQICAPQGLDSKTPDEIEQTLSECGQKVYGIKCASCHGPEGKGAPGSYPPLAGSDYPGFLDPKSHAQIIAKGLGGKITVLGAEYNGVMPPQTLTDYEIAAVATFERNSWGNDHGIVSLENVVEARK